MAPVQRSRQNRARKYICSNSAERWTPEQYRAQMLMRGVAESGAANTLGFARYLKPAEQFGILEKRPNTERVDRVPQQREAVA